MQGHQNLNKPSNHFPLKFKNRMMTDNSILLNVIPIFLNTFRNKLEPRSLEGLKFKLRDSSILKKECQEKYLKLTHTGQ